MPRRTDFVTIVVAFQKCPHIKNSVPALNQAGARQVVVDLATIAERHLAAQLAASPVDQIVILLNGVLLWFAHSSGPLSASFAAVFVRLFYPNGRRLRERVKRRVSRNTP